MIVGAAYEAFIRISYSQRRISKGEVEQGFNARPPHTSKWLVSVSGYFTVQPEAVTLTNNANPTGIDGNGGFAGIDTLPPYETIAVAQWRFAEYPCVWAINLSATDPEEAPKASKTISSDVVQYGRERLRTCRPKYDDIYCLAPKIPESKWVRRERSRLVVR